MTDGRASVYSRFQTVVREEKGDDTVIASSVERMCDMWKEAGVQAGLDHRHVPNSIPEQGVHSEKIRPRV